MSFEFLQKLPTPEEIKEQTLSDLLYTAGQPDPDLIIRPSGEMRISNFLLWQSAYAEFVFMDILKQETNNVYNIKKGAIFDE